MAGRLDVKGFVFQPGLHSLACHGISALLCCKAHLSPLTRNRSTQDLDALSLVWPEMGDEEEKQKLSNCDTREYELFPALN